MNDIHTQYVEKHINVIYKLQKYGFLLTVYSIMVYTLKIHTSTTLI